MSTFAQLQTRVSSNVIDLQTATQTNIPVYVNAVIEAAQSLHNFNAMKAEIHAFEEMFPRAPTPEPETHARDGHAMKRHGVT